jgi:hypothetical protein
VRFPMSSTDQLLSSTSYPAESGAGGGRLDELLEATVALLMRAVSNLGVPEEDETLFGATPARSAARIAADAARLTAAVAQLVRAHHLHTAPAPQAATNPAAAALAALMTELDAEADAAQERTRP